MVDDDESSPMASQFHDKGYRLSFKKMKSISAFGERNLKSRDGMGRLGRRTHVEANRSREISRGDEERDGGGAWSDAKKTTTVVFFGKNGVGG